jgi:hypothetical protein
MGAIVQMIMMRDHGKRLSKTKLFDRSNSRYVGRCVVSEIQDIETRRTMSIARFANSPDGEGGCRLYDARLVWMNEDGRFMLTGFERRQNRGDEIEYAQSWLVFPHGDMSAMRQGQ